jgi:hypothetical protein
MSKIAPQAAPAEIEHYKNIQLFVSIAKSMLTVDSRWRSAVERRGTVVLL